uniref:uncharacterized protein LOC131140546 n=1 Tax=Doryrhamphus excisus TaxID=161450 RepID=UPI0025AE8F9E|nr:uncharacterized protein LOC131140546 [Doryrhamphus excisus]XP_057947056.1 uncharacterized protein LOC131140546 [Doryrhamphus excisus]XP_057947057.1 uncharacterized protein LOC131140546 [Doryrhamphus excisus]
MEQEDCHPHSLAAILLAPIPISRSLYNNNPLIHSMIRIWKQIKASYNLNSISPALPIDRNPTFAPSGLGGSFAKWSQKGIKCVGHLYIQGIFASFSQLQHKFGLENNSFFQYLQIRDYIRKHMEDFRNESKTLINECLKLTIDEPKLITRIYKALLSMTPSPAHIHKHKWEKELGETITEDLWDSALEKINTCSHSARHCLIQFKIIYMLHFSKEKLHNIYPDVSPICDKCRSSKATHLHSYALCPKIYSFWSGVFDIMSKVLGIVLKPEPLLIILGVSESFQMLNKAQQCFISYGLIIAKKLILMLWKSVSVPSTKMWLEELTNTLHLERIRYILKDRLQHFETSWQPFVQYLVHTNQA